MLQNKRNPPIKLEKKQISEIGNLTKVYILK